MLDSGDVFAEESEEKLEIDSVVDRIVVECSLPVELSGLPGVKNVVTGFFFVRVEELDDLSMDINHFLLRTTSSRDIDCRT